MSVKNQPWFQPWFQPYSDQNCIFFRTPSETLAQEFAEYVTLRKASSAAAAAREAAMAAAAKIVEPSAFYPQPTSSPSPIAVPEMSPAPAYRYSFCLGCLFHSTGRFPSLFLRLTRKMF